MNHKDQQTLVRKSFLKQVVNKKLDIMDATGKKIRWLQYLLEEQQLDYVFLKGGVWSYYQDKAAIKH
ncbi:hypothetical protein ACMAZF_07310 [Psychrobium sp. nBUS_13]|uniref:hypothetical protein n=1 Tax=Psychrobium sp. nBUS_13 TaxID=3395319 RepID=UPI003EBB3F20